MNNKKFVVFFLIIVNFTLFTACNSTVQSPKQIYLYGESHGIPKIIDKEFELWNEYYHKNGMRHLFVELPYYTGEYLNIWMRSDDDDILDKLFQDLAGTPASNPYSKDFYKKIKSKCPETVFHGTDVGHQYNSTGYRFLEYLKSNNLKGSDQYLLTQAAINQGEYYSTNSDYVYRENQMTENFILEFDKLKDESIMGIYGAAHTGLDAMDFTSSVPCMGNQLKKHYGNTIHSEDLSSLKNEPQRIDTINVDGKDYKASYFGKENISWSKEYAYREFWRLENAYNEFKDKPKTSDILPYDNYPTTIETGQVFVIDYTKTDSSVTRKYYRSDGYVWNGKLSTEEFTLE